MSAQAAGTVGLRERTRQAVRTEIGATAMRLFVEQGFDATTIDQIADHVGISRRSFFRYFPTKEDIVLGHCTQLGVTVSDALKARPAGEPPYSALRAAFEVLVEDPAYSLERSLTISKMLLETPALRAGYLERQRQWQELLVPIIAVRLGGQAGTTTPDTRAQAIVACALTCLDIASDAWTRSNGEGSIEEIFDEVLAAVRGS